MKSSIFIPKTINVGFQFRSDTYTGKLAYVIYYDEKGKLRKETSWNNWRNKNIEPKIFDNIPTSGFVLNKKVGDYVSDWNHRKAYCRVYDPRNFEFEITIENLLYILENASSIKGKGLEGEFVYGWDGKDLILIPVESPDYNAIVDYSNIINENKFIKAKDLKVGATYLGHLGKMEIQFIYMGKYDRWEYCYKKAGKIFTSYWSMKKYCIKHNIEPDEIRRGRCSREEIWYSEEEGYMPYEKCHVFHYIDDYYRGELANRFVWYKNINNKLISCIDENCSENYADLFDKLETTTEYSPIDSSKEEHFSYAFDEFQEYVNNKGQCVSPIYTYDNDVVSLRKENNSFIIRENDKAIKYGFMLGKKSYSYSNTDDMIQVSLEEIYQALKPYYKKIYLRNGRLLRMEGI